MVVLRPFEERDRERVKEVASRAFPGLGLARLAIDKSLPRDAVKEAYRREAEGYIKKVLEGDENLGIIVAEEGGTITGHIILGVNKEWSDIFGFKWGSILSLAVDPDWWGKGIGSKLVKEGLRWLKKKGVRYAEVFTDQNNVAAIKVYEKNGFRVIYSGIILSQYLDE